MNKIGDYKIILNYTSEDIQFNDSLDVTSK